jgi:hypothetical protein
MDAEPSPVLEVLADLEASMDRAHKVFGAGLWQSPAPEVVDVVKRLHRFNAQGQGLQLMAVREVDVRGIPAELGSVSLRAFLGHALTMSPGLAGEHARLSEALASRFTATAAALAAGGLAYEQARAIVDTVNGLPRKASGDERERAEAYLLGLADVLNAKDLRGIGKLMDAVIDPDGTPDREEAARSKRGADMRDNHNGTQTLTWTDVDENMALAKAAIESLSAPVPGQDGVRDPRSASQRRADALVEINRRVLEAGDLPGSRGVRPHLHVTFTEQTMRGEPGAPHGRASTGEYLSPQTIERLLCDASVTGILLDGAGVPLKVGRTERTVGPGQWKALVARDVGCQFIGCTRPAAWCQAHHLIAWSRGGRTDVDAMGLFCLVHHHYLHDKGWQARIGPDGRVEIVPPPWVDPLQEPRRNHHWLTPQDFRDFVADPSP